MTSALDITQAVNPPRAVFVNFPLGHQTGKPHQPALQRQIVSDAMRAFETIERPGTIVSIPLGYADGWPRALSSDDSGSNAEVLIGGKRYPAVGTVCMDAFMADMGDDSCEVGDEVVLIGSQGKETIGADDVARALDTINYEVVTRISSRIPRVYRG